MSSGFRSRDFVAFSRFAAISLKHYPFGYHLGLSVYRNKSFLFSRLAIVTHLKPRERRSDIAYSEVFEHRK